MSLGVPENPTDQCLGLGTRLRKKLSKFNSFLVVSWWTKTPENLKTKWISMENSMFFLEKTIPYRNHKPPIKDAFEQKISAIHRSWMVQGIGDHLEYSTLGESTMN